MSTPSGLDQLLAIMARLRDPDGGCPWDLEQTFATIAPYTVEEAYEVADAIERGDMGDLKEELGDLLLQVVFHSRMAEEAGLFAFDDVARAIADKMERRHPHVFADVRHDSLAAQGEPGIEPAVPGVRRPLLVGVPGPGSPSLGMLVSLGGRWRMRPPPSPSGFSIQDMCGGLQTDVQWGDGGEQVVVSVQVMKYCDKLSSHRSQRA